MKKVLPVILAIVMFSGAFGHVAAPEFYEPMIPQFIPVGFANYLTFFLEALVGILLLIPNYKKWGGMWFMILMLGFLPIHVWDLFREEPAIGPSPAPVTRLVLQFLLIYAGFWVYRSYRNN